MANFKYNYVPLDKIEDQKEKKDIHLKEGRMHFTIFQHYDKDREGRPLKTATGSPKSTLAFKVTDSLGQKGLVYDIFTPNTGWKVKHLADAIGMPDLYNENASIDFDKLVGMSGSFITKYESRAGSMTAPKLVVDRYLMNTNPNGAIMDDGFEPVEDDNDLPF